MAHQELAWRSLRATDIPLIVSSQLLVTLPLLVGLGLFAIFRSVTDTPAVLFPFAFLFGWTQMGGLCGTAHVNTMRILWLQDRSVWLKSTCLYTLCGLASSVGVGAVLGVIGQTFGRNLWSIDIWGLACLSAILTVRELGWVKFRLFEWCRQTNRNWAYQFGWVSASAMWGFHIGLAVFTVVTYGGFWALAAFIVIVGNPLLGVFLMTAYWTGRSLPLWIVSPFLRTHPWKVDYTYALFRRAHIIALASFTLVIVLYGLRGLVP